MMKQFKQFLRIGNMKHTSRGYTIIEMLIVITLLTIIMPAVFSIIYTLLSHQMKMYRIIETKRQGDRIMSFMKEKIIREAMGIKRANNTIRCGSYTATPETTTNGNDFLFMKSTDPNGDSFNFYLVNSTFFVQDTSGLAATSLHDTKVRVTNFQIECFRRNSSVSPSQPNKNIVTVGFTYTVEYIDNSPTQSEGTTSLQYQTKIRLR